MQQMGIRSNKAIVEMLATAREPLTKDPQLVASMLQGAMAGVSRRLLESDAPEKQFEALRQELIFLRVRLPGSLFPLAHPPKGKISGSLNQHQRDALHPNGRSDSATASRVGQVRRNAPGAPGNNSLSRVVHVLICAYIFNPRKTFATSRKRIS